MSFFPYVIIHLMLSSHTYDPFNSFRIFIVLPSVLLSSCMGHLVLSFYTHFFFHTLFIILFCLMPFFPYAFVHLTFLSIQNSHSHSLLVYLLCSLFLPSYIYRVFSQNISFKDYMVYIMSICPDVLIHLTRSFYTYVLFHSEYFSCGCSFWCVYVV